LRGHDGKLVGAIQSLRDVTERRVAENALRRAHDNLEQTVRQRTAQLAEDIRQRQSAEEELRRRNIELTELNETLSRTQQQLVQSDKLASIGQLAAGVAHEINNPIGYIFSNFGTLQSYLDSLFSCSTPTRMPRPPLSIRPWRPACAPCATRSSWASCAPISRP
jgi:signal transduction histidine kinase